MLFMSFFVLKDSLDLDFYLIKNIVNMVMFWNGTI